MTLPQQALRRASNLQYIISNGQYGSHYMQQKHTELREAFYAIFPMGVHLWDKLTRYYDGEVCRWIRSLDCENEKIFMEDERFNFLN